MTDRSAHEIITEYAECLSLQPAGHLSGDEANWLINELRDAGCSLVKLDDELVEHLSDALFKWNTPDNPYFVILGRGDWTNPDDVDADPYDPIARAIVAALKERAGNGSP